MKFLVFFASVLVLAFAGPCPDPPPPPPPNPYYKVIYDKGHVLTTANSDDYKEIHEEYVNDLFHHKFLHKQHWPHDEYMVITRGDKPWSEISFVIEHKPGHKCDDAPPHLKPLIKKCKGDMELRDLTDAEKAKIAKSKDTIAAITDKDTKLAYKVTYNEAKIMIEQSGDMKQVKVEDVFNPGSQKIHAMVEPGKEAYIIMHNGDPMKKEQFVVESTPDPHADCTKTSLDRLLCWCSGNLKLREMTADEKASFSLT